MIQNVREYFSQFGEVAEVMVMKDPATRRSRGFGFITFTNAVSVQGVLALPSHTIDGKVVEPKVTKIPSFDILDSVAILNMQMCEELIILCMLSLGGFSF